MSRSFSSERNRGRKKKKEKEVAFRGPNVLPGTQHVSGDSVTSGQRVWEQRTKTSF